MRCRNATSLVLALALGACAARRPVARAAPPVGPSPWDAMGFVERHQVMTFDVLPNMSREFQAAAHADVPTLRCASCHGADALDVHYRMPRTLPALPRDVLARREPDPRRARTLAFMRDVVTPRMARMLGRPVFDPATGRGFSCFGCHVAQERSDAP